MGGWVYHFQQCWLILLAENHRERTEVHGLDWQTQWNYLPPCRLLTKSSSPEHWCQRSTNYLLHWVSTKSWSSALREFDWVKCVETFKNIYNVKKFFLLELTFFFEFYMKEKISFRWYWSCVWHCFFINDPCMNFCKF